MGQRSRSNYKVTKNSRIKANGIGAITGQIDSDDREDIADSFANILDEFIVGGNFDVNGLLSNSAVLSWDAGNKILSSQGLVTSQTAVALTITGILSGSRHSLLIRKSGASDCVITFTVSPRTLFGLGNVGAITTITLVGAVDSRFILDFNAISNSSLFVNVVTPNVNASPGLHNRGSWNTINTLPPSSNVEDDEWKVPLGSVWTYGDDNHPGGTIIRSLVDGANTYAQFKKY